MAAVPEEIKRRVAGSSADLHFAVTERSRQSLFREGGPEGRVLLSGNLVIDALQWVASLLVLTDSGGLREEARGLGKPVLVLSEVTERPEGVEAGTVKAVGTKREDITGEAVLRLEDPTASAAIATAVNPYGDGRTGQRIVRAMLGSTRIHGAMNR